MYLKLLLLGLLPINIPSCIGIAAIPKIAIVGGGIGGTSCAYYLRKLFDDSLSITLFEKDKIGGRLATIAVAGEEFEAGGAVIHPRNKYVSDFANMLGLKRRKEHSGLWGIYDGKDFVFQTSPWTAVTLAKLYWRYGWSVFKLDSMLKSLLNDFSKIYDAQEKGKAFTSVVNLLGYMNSNFPNMTRRTLTSYLKAEGYSEPFIEELAQAIMLVNYGQTTDIDAFVGVVSLAGSESGLWSIKGGNKQVPIGLLEKSKAKLVQAEVTSTLLQVDGSFQLTYKLQSTNTIVMENFDVVVIAAPLIHDSSIKFLNFTKDMRQYEGIYHHMFSSFVEGLVNEEFFNTNPVPDVILTNNATFIFKSLGVSFPVSDNELPGPRKVYKVFSKAPLFKSRVNKLFKDAASVKSRNWLAYPHYLIPQKIPPFMLYPNLYYLNAIEWSASAMEMSAIAGRNIALLIHNTWTDNIGLIDTLNEVHKDEL